MGHLNSPDGDLNQLGRVWEEALIILFLPVLSHCFVSALLHCEAMVKSSGLAGEHMLEHPAQGLHAELLNRGHF